MSSPSSTDCSKLCVALVCDVSLPTAHIVRELDKAIELCGKPEAFRSDNAPEFIAKVLDEWACTHGIQHHFIRPGKRIENAFAESFGHARTRDLPLGHARMLAELRRPTIEAAAQDA